MHLFPTRLRIESGGGGVCVGLTIEWVFLKMITQN